jgi:hypothetical protein
MNSCKTFAAIAAFVIGMTATGIAVWTIRDETGESPLGNP